MEQARTRRESTRRIGPYRLITRLDPPGSPAPCRRFVARGEDGRTVLLSTPLPGADPARFAVEAEAGRHVVGPWLAPVTRVSGPFGGAGAIGGAGAVSGAMHGAVSGAGAEAVPLPGAVSGAGAGAGAAPVSSPAPTAPAWYATPYLPVLPLPVALAVHGGPLPEAVVRGIGVALAETLAAVHAGGLAHAGVSPAAVLIAAGGPLLSCFGTVRAAGPDGEPRAGLPGIDPGALAPEQAAGGRPRPPGDVFALGAVLAHAATGHTVPERDELPDGLRPVVAACLARDPADRPTAAALAASLAPPAPAPSLLAPGWLPGRVVAALARQSAELLAAELPPLPERAAHGPVPV
ncbi:serine/threonine protein kinase [Streptomyces sp. NPDC057242]|uniref:serine/threonine protein kinase n=1 Tax=unclassified Streptomyces TaxID=2593676 RepID=UPI003638EAF7